MDLVASSVNVLPVHRCRGAHTILFYFPFHFLSELGADRTPDEMGLQVPVEKGIYGERK